MASPEVDPSLPDPSCRILTIASSIDLAVALISRIIQLKDTLKQLDKISPPESSFGNDAIKVPWTISNRYYTANVHFAAHAINSLSCNQFENVPAVIYVWEEGEEYRDHILRLAQDIEACNVEVLLAVKTKRKSVPDERLADEDDYDVDDFLSSHGFEYIDATVDVPMPVCRSKRNEEATADDIGIPRLPRVLDALSTIMWSSMNSKHKSDLGNSKHGGQTKGRLQLDWTRISQDPLMKTLEELTIREVAEYRSSVTPNQDPWRFAVDTGTVVTSSDEMAVASPFLSDMTDQEYTYDSTHLGFEDDFTVFISAPAVENDGYNSSQSSRSSPDHAVRHQSKRRLPDVGEVYRSLGSMSDFGDAEAGRTLDFDEIAVEKASQDNDDLLPAKEEILETSAKIFGRKASIVSANAPLVDDDDLRIDSNQGSYEIAPFDLPRVLSALQQMKAEISIMEDEDERRKAAARVTLGLVYGLQKDDVSN